MVDWYKKSGDHGTIFSVTGHKRQKLNFKVSYIVILYMCM